MLNAQLITKQRSLASAREKKEWRTVIWLHERPYRLQALLSCPIDDDARFWNTLSLVWTDCEGPAVNFSIWHQLFTSSRPGREGMMDEDEKVALAALPSRFRVYRGASTIADAKKGFSWTTSREQAAWFARRFTRGHALRQPYVCVGVVNKSDVIALLNRRDEHEILVDSKNVKGKLVSAA